MEILAGIVLYNPNISRLNENIQAIYKQIDKLILVDNGSNNIELINEIASNYNKIFFIRNEDNKGISVALNQILKVAVDNKFQWVLLLDQDSVCPPNLINEYLKFTHMSDVAIICPTIVDRNEQIIERRTSTNIEYEYVTSCITSGSLIKSTIWTEVGYFDEKMFIDYVDIEYCKRVKNSGYKILMLNNISLLHEIGHKKTYKFLWTKISTYNHSAFRKYYITRNTLYYTKKYREEESIFIAYLKIIKRFIIVLMYEDDKNEKIKAIFKGIKDSFNMD